MVRSMKLFMTAFVFAPSLCFAQALVVTNDETPMPRTWRPPTGQAFTITSLDITANIRDRAAEVTVSQSFKNDSARTQEVQFLFPLPSDAAVDEMTLLVDGEEFPAQLLTAAEARARYQAIVRSKKDPALLEFVGGQCFQTRVFPVPVGAERTVTVHYTRLLPKDFGLVDLELPLSATKLSAKPVAKVNVAVHVESDRLASVYSPSHAVKIERPTSGHAQVSWNATNITPDDDFRLIFDTDRGESDIGGRLLTYRPDTSEDGFFLFLATPVQATRDDASEQQAKTVLFVLDRSGSMTGTKIGQARDAMQFVLDNLNQRDTFNILTYANQNKFFQPELIQANSDNLANAGVFAAGVAAGGGTNIHAALTAAIEQAGDSSQATYLLFLTDGKPTVGVRKPAEISQAVSAANEHGVRIVSFGVGEKVNSKLLDRISTENGGFSAYVRPSDDIEDAISKVFRRLTSPILIDAQLQFAFKKAPKATPTNFVYPGRSIDLFAGQELIVVGRYRATGKATATLAGRVGEEQQEFEFPVKFAKQQSDSRLAFIEKLWATRRIGDLINQMDLNGVNEELVDELVALSTKHGIMTPYTSFLADEETNLGDQLSTRTRSRRLLESLKTEDGASGFSQRGVKQAYGNADFYASPALSNGISQEAESFDDGLSVTRGRTPAAAGRFSDAGGAVGEVVTIPALIEEQRRQAEGKADQTLAPAVQDASGITLYRRGRILVTPETANLDLETTEFVDVERFTEAYFELVSTNTEAENALFSRQSEGDELIIRLRGQNYRIR